MKLVLVTATGTEVGKTWVSARLLEALRARGVNVGARKPAQSFAAGEGPTDAELLAAAAGSAPAEVCPRHRWYELAMAPPMAAERLGRPGFTIADLASELGPSGEVCLVEGAGGWRSPLASDGDTLALAAAIRPELVVLVAGAALGAIHQVRSCLDSISFPVAVFLNRYDAADAIAAANLSWLRDRDGLDVVVDIESLVTRVCAPQLSGRSSAD